VPLQSIQRPTEVPNRLRQRHSTRNGQSRMRGEIQKEGRNSLALQVIGDLPILVGSGRRVVTENRDRRDQAATRDDQERRPLRPRAARERKWGFHPARVLSREQLPPTP